MRIGAIIGMLFSAIATSNAAQLSSDSEITLYCTGTTWSQIIHQGETPIDAIVRFSNKAIYIEINAVGSGHATSPKVVSSMEVAGVITLSSAFQGQPDIKANYNLNRYSGSLVVFPAEQKVLFSGGCKRAVPLF